VTKAKIDRAALLKIIDNPQFEFSVTPKNTYRWPNSSTASARSRTSRSRGRTTSSRTPNRCKGADRHERPLQGHTASNRPCQHAAAAGGG
jgi:hypothetical protein